MSRVIEYRGGHRPRRTDVTARLILDPESDFYIPEGQDPEEARRNIRRFIGSSLPEPPPHYRHNASGPGLDNVARDIDIFGSEVLSQLRSSLIPLDAIKRRYASRPGYWHCACGMDWPDATALCLACGLVQASSAGEPITIQTTGNGYAPSAARMPTGGPRSITYAYIPGEPVSVEVEYDNGRVGGWSGFAPEQIATIVEEVPAGAGTYDREYAGLHELRKQLAEQRGRRFRRLSLAAGALTA